jgi:S1-C subfamily serine protease
LPFVVLPLPAEKKDGMVLARGAMIQIRDVFSVPSLDLALLRLFEPPKTQMPSSPASLQLADSTSREGDEIALCGFPLGLRMHQDVSGGLVLNASFSSGIVSSELPFPEAPLSERNFFQVNASINPGNSGGPIFDLSAGNVVGVVSKWSRIPLAGMLSELGVKVDPDAKPQYGMPLGHGRGAHVERVQRMLNQVATYGWPTGKYGYKETLDPFGPLDAPEEETP